MTIEVVDGDVPETCEIEGEEYISDLGKPKHILGKEPVHSLRDTEDTTVKESSSV
ncbi:MULTISPECIES: hypothetical protein [Haloferacaceae]|uniref:Uncharacterized protein n=1 Tax=Halorubrum glutamatedens TaxID=2707018 RepID=A0ABD5QUF3_9EURY|nr:hypothetical protein [Halobellus captivus]